MALSKLSRRGLCLAITLAAVACQRSVTVELERDEIQRRLAAKFPLQKPVLLATITFENPSVILREGSDRIGVELDVKLQAPLLPPYSGKLAVNGKPSYRPAEKAFYLHEAGIERLELPGLPPAEAEKLRAPVEVVMRAALDQVPVYQLQKRDWKEVSAEHALQAVKVENGKLRATFGF